MRREVNYTLIKAIGLLLFVIALFTCIIISTLNEGIRVDEAMIDRICTIRKSHDMARITLCESGREFTLIVEEEDSLGNPNYNIINSFVTVEETTIFKQKNKTRVYLIDSQGNKLHIEFEVSSGGKLVRGKIVK